MTGSKDDTILKRDVFSETRRVFLGGPDGGLGARRDISASPWYARPLARFLARAEIRSLQAADGIPGLPRLIEHNRYGLTRSWVEGTPLHLAKPSGPEWYRDAGRLLREFRRRGITHNDLAKPQNWLQTPDGGAAVIDFQLARVHRRKGRLYRLMAYEDLRHLLKQKRAYAPNLLTPTEWRMVERRSAPSRLWRATGKRAYNAITRGIFGWSDREGASHRIATDGPATREALLTHPKVRDVALAAYPLPRKGSGLYAFCECETGVDAAELEALQKAKGGHADLIQTVEALPRDTSGTARTDILALIAQNRIDETEPLTISDPALTETVRKIATARRNLTDRRLRH